MKKLSSLLPFALPISLTLMIVLAISIVVGMHTSRRRLVRRTVYCGICQRNPIQALATAIDAYEVDNGHFPNDLRCLLVNPGAPNWNGPYYRGNDNFYDVWETPTSTD
jgi:hypothetical protein